MFMCHNYHLILHCDNKRLVSFRSPDVHTATLTIFMKGFRRTFLSDSTFITCIIIIIIVILCCCQGKKGYSANTGSWSWSLRQLCRTNIHGFSVLVLLKCKNETGNIKTTFPVNVLCHLRLLHTYNFNVCEFGQTAPIIFVPFHNPVFPSLCMPESSITEATKCFSNHQ